MISIFLNLSQLCSISDSLAAKVLKLVLKSSWVSEPFMLLLVSSIRLHKFWVSLERIADFDSSLENLIAGSLEDIEVLSTEYW